MSFETQISEKQPGVTPEFLSQQELSYAPVRAFQADLDAPYKSATTSTGEQSSEFLDLNAPIFPNENRLSRSNNLVAKRSETASTNNSDQMNPLTEHKLSQLVDDIINTCRIPKELKSFQAGNGAADEQVLDVDRVNKLLANRQSSLQIGFCQTTTDIKFVELRNRDTGKLINFDIASPTQTVPPPG